MGRFGNHFLGRVANPAEMLLFKKMQKGSRDGTLGSTLADGSTIAGTPMEDHEDDRVFSIEDMISEHFENNDEAQLELLGIKGIAKAFNAFVNKNDKQAMSVMVKKQVEIMAGKMIKLEVSDDETFDETLKVNDYSAFHCAFLGFKYQT